jgi:hypothetical protein
LQFEGKNYSLNTCVIYEAFKKVLVVKIISQNELAMELQQSVCSPCPFIILIKSARG